MGELYEKEVVFCKVPRKSLTTKSSITLEPLGRFRCLLALNSKRTTVYSIPNFQPRPSKNQNETFFNFQAYGNIPSPPAVPSTTGFQNQGSGVRSESVAGDRRRKVPGFNEVEIGPGGTGRLGAILVSSGLGGPCHAVPWRWPCQCHASAMPRRAMPGRASASAMASAMAMAMPCQTVAASLQALAAAQMRISDVRACPCAARSVWHVGVDRAWLWWRFAALHGP